MPPATRWVSKGSACRNAPIRPRWPMRVSESKAPRPAYAARPPRRRPHPPYQAAVAYARARIQGTGAGIRGGPRVPIVRHPDVRRMLLLMKSQTDAMRALAGVVAVSLDAGRPPPRAGEGVRP